MKGQNGYAVEAREVDFKRMLWWILKQWRIIILFGIIGAIILGAWQYAKDYKANQAQYQSALENVKQGELTTEELESILTDEKVIGVKNTIEYWKIEKDTLEYLENSILMNLDLFKENIAYMEYQSDAAEDAVLQIKKILSDEKALQIIKNQMGWEQVEERFILELIKVESLSDRIVVKIAGTEAEQCEQLAAIVQKCIDDAKISVELKEWYNTIIVDDENIERKNTILEAYNKNHVYYLNNYSTLDNNQLKLLQLYLDEEEESVEYSIEEQPIVLEKTKLSVKKIILGFAGFVIVAIVILGIGYTFSPNVHGAKELNYLFGIAPFIIINLENLKKKKKLFSSVDHWVNRMENHSVGKMPYEQQVRMAATNIYLACRKANVESLVISSSRYGSIPKKFFEDLKYDLKERHIEVKETDSILLDADALLTASEKGAIVFAEINEKSDCATIAEELNACLHNQIQVLGAVMIQS